MQRTLYWYITIHRVHLTQAPMTGGLRSKLLSEANRITKKLVEAGKVISIEVQDHIIIAGESYFSFKEAGMLS